MSFSGSWLCGTSTIQMNSRLWLFSLISKVTGGQVPKYPALQQRIAAPSFFSRANPFSPQISLDRLDMPDSQLLIEIGNRLLPIFEVAYSVKLDPEVQAQNIALFAEASLNSYLDISHRRLFAKALITEWYRQKEQSEQVINVEYAEKLIRGERDALMALADDQQAPY